VKGVSIAGIGSYLPQTVITNDDIATLVDTNDEWITSRTGIKARRVVSGNETVASLGIAAAHDALACADMRGEDIELIIVASSTPDTIYPMVCSQIQAALGAKKAAGFDMVLACTGFVYALTTASQFIRTGMVKNALVICSDIHSRFTDWSDRNTCILFGDGAGSLVLKADDTDHLLACDLHLDGTKGDHLTMHTTVQNCPLVEPRDVPSPYVYMNGREVFKFAVGTVPTSIQAAVAQAGLQLNDIDYFVPHQANVRIMHAMAEKLNVPLDKWIINLEETGNTSAASIPIALNEAVKSGKVQPGQTLVFCGFGAGLSWATAVVRWSLVDKRPQRALAATTGGEL
jgi:3-oxoacyl-[acyl-carrier-protein] synthase-3